MQGFICYHSSSGHTRLMCQYARRKLTSAAFDLFDITTGGPLPDLSAYDAIGFATWTYYMGLPPRFAAFLDALPHMPGKAVFVLSSFGMMPGWSLRLTERALAAKGCLVLGGAALHMPENFPPLIIKGMDSPQAPEPKELIAFDAFLDRLNGQLDALSRGESPQKTPVPFDWLSYLIRPFPVHKARKDMGQLAVDAERCGGCQTCRKTCLYHAIRLEDNRPVFDETRCQACYACFNHCPKQAIYTTRIRGKGQYAGPSAGLKERLAA